MASSCKLRRVMWYIDVIVTSFHAKKMQIHMSSHSFENHTALRSMTLYIPCQANVQFFHPGACSQCFQASQKLPSVWIEPRSKLCILLWHSQIKWSILATIARQDLYMVYRYVESDMRMWLSCVFVGAPYLGHLKATVHFWTEVKPGNLVHSLTKSLHNGLCREKTVH
jgi:competence transcription factor ComK